MFIIQYISYGTARIWAVLVHNKIYVTNIATYNVTPSMNINILIEIYFTTLYEEKKKKKKNSNCHHSSVCFHENAGCEFKET